MRDYAKISTSLWRSRKFRALRDDDQARLLYLYFHTCAQVTSVGCFSIPLGYIETDLGWLDDQVRKAIERLSKALLVVWNEGEELILLVDFIQHDPPTNPNHAAAVAKVALSLPDCPEKLRVIEDLLGQEYKSKKHDLTAESERLSKAFPKAIETPYPIPTPTPIPTPIPNPLPPSVPTGPAPPLAANGSDIDLTIPDKLQHPDGVATAVAAFNEVAERCGLPVAQKLTNARRQKLRARLRDCDGLEGWQVAMAKLEATKGLHGDNDRGWKADLDFLLQESKFTKLMEGSYDGWTGDSAGGEAFGKAEAEARDRAGIAAAMGLSDDGRREYPVEHSNAGRDDSARPVDDDVAASEQ